MRRTRLVGLLVVTWSLATMRAQAEEEDARAGKTSESVASLGHRTHWDSLAVDVAGLGSTTDAPRSDFAYYHLVTLRHHMSVGRAAAVSVGVGLPLLQALFLA